MVIANVSSKQISVASQEAIKVPYQIANAATVHGWMRQGSKVSTAQLVNTDPPNPLQ